MNFKRIVCIILSAVLMLPLAAPATVHAAYFPDVSGHWAEFHIRKVYSENIISGYPNGRFMPDKSVTRAEFVVMVNNTFELDRLDSYEAVKYSDVAVTSWFYNHISTALTAGYAVGYGDNTFRPNTPITREEAAVFLASLIPEGKKKGNLKSFPDARLIDKSATDAMTKMVGKGYIGGYNDKRLHPRDPITRAQAAKIISEIIDNEEIITRRTTVDMDKTILSAKTFVGNVLIDEDLEDGSATIDNCIILGNLIIEGGGDGTVTLNNTRVSKAIIDREDGRVRVVAKGNTIVSKLEASESCYLQSSGKDGFGFPDITLKGSSDVILKGVYPLVSVLGSRASLTLESGEITSLTVTGVGKYSDITLSGKSKIIEAVANAECYFHGQGTIGYLYVNADDITYETKPDKMTVGLQVDRPEAEGDEEVAVTFRPKSKADDVDVDTKITITFNTSMKLAGGGEIGDSNISNFVSLHVGSKSGTEVEFTGSINSSKKVITLTPSARLAKGTRYYIVLADEALKNAGGYENEGKSSYFITEGDPEPAPTPTPSPGTTPALSGLALTPADTSIAASFTPNLAGTVYAMASTSAATPTKEQIIAANKTAAAAANTAGTLSFTGLTANTRYYVYAFLRNSAGTDSAIVSSNALTTISEAALSNLTAAPNGGSNRLSGFNSAVKTYSVVMPIGTTSIDVTAAVNAATHTNAAVTINGTAGSSLTGISVASGTATVTVTVSADNKTTAAYTINVTVNP